MRNRSSAVVCLLMIVSIALLGCGAEEENDLGHTESQYSLDEEKQYDHEIEEIRAKGREELGVDEIFIPEMKELKIANAFVSYFYDTNEPMQIDVQYHAEVADRNERFENEIIVEEHLEETGVKYLVPPYVNHGDLYFWFIFSKQEMPEMLHHDDGGIDEEWIEIAGNTVLFANNGTDYRYYVPDRNGHYMFGYAIEQYSKDAAEGMTGNFIAQINSQQYN